MSAPGNTFSENARAAVADPQLRRAMQHVKEGFIGKRAKAAARLPEFEALRDASRDIKDHTLDHLDLYLERYEAQVIASGGHVHWCAGPAEARAVILDICRQAGARTVTKGKTMIGEEIDINAHLEAAGITPVETDLGEYIVQMRGERPSHIIAPAVHLTKDVIEADFRAQHRHLPADRSLEHVSELVDEARGILRQRFLDADVGITGANFLIAETGSSIIVTNEGNGDLTQTLPRVHIVIASLEKVVPTFEDAATILRVLARSATGQEFSAYTTVSTGPKRAGDLDGPEAYHVVLLDNGRSDLLDGPFRDILRCIRCGACINHCPVYHAIGGHAYGSVYPGPIGAVLTPVIEGIAAAADLPEASTFCGRCEAVCPVRIPLPKLMRHWRERAYAQRVTPGALRAGIGLWAFFARRPALYGFVTGVAARLLALMGGRRGRLARVPFAGGWTRFRDLPAPEGRTFRALWAARKGARQRQGP